DIQLMIDIIKEVCPVKSGCPVEKFTQRVTNEMLYSIYEIRCQELCRRVYCYKTFIKTRNSLHITRQRKFWGHFDCPQCQKMEKVDKAMLRLKRTPRPWTQLQDNEYCSLDASKNDLQKHLELAN